MTRHPVSAQIRALLDLHAVELYEATQYEKTPWPDPDGGTLRFMGVIEAVLDVCDTLDPTTAERVRTAIADRLEITTSQTSPPAETPIPERIQRQRTAGWRMPPNTVYVGRPSKWGNPFVVGETHGNFGRIRSAERAVDLFELHIGPMGNYEYDDGTHNLEELRGKNLACWCPLDQPCHADWVRSLCDQCQAAGVAFFLKQWGEWGPAPWRVDREPGESVADYKARAEATCATHAYQSWAHNYGHDLYEAPHKPWSAERTELPPSAAGMRRWGKKAAGRELDGRVHDDYPTLTQV